VKLNEIFDQIKNSTKQQTGVQLDAITSAAPTVDSKLANAVLSGITSGAAQGAKAPVAKPKAKAPAAGGNAAPAPAPAGPSYMDQLNSLYDQIMGRGPFQYDLNGDLLYRQMADQYTQLGRMAMRDATGTAAGLTGGYANSYANQVGNQQFQQYLTALNEQIPALYDRARDAWDDETAQLMADYDMILAHKQNVDAMTPKASGGAAKKKDASTGQSSIWDKLWQQVQTAGAAGTADVSQGLMDKTKSAFSQLIPYYNDLHNEEQKKRK
jgi:hypothetical protein